MPVRKLSRPVAEIARSHRCDARLGQTVPGFDAPFFQAGLAGYSDGPMRLMARRHGCPFCVTEALLDRTLINGGKGRRREDPDIIACECGSGDIPENQAATVDDHPIAGQIIGSTPSEMAEGAVILAGMGYEIIDVNLACPVKKVRNRARGGHFLSQPDDAIGILRAVRAAVPAHIPCSVKLRRAFDDTPAMAMAFERIFHASYELGYVWATVHCRTVQQRYLGPGRWEFLTDLVKRNPDRIVLGSGDVWTVADIFAMLECCGVQAVAVARGCIGNPWIFRQARAMMRGEEGTSPTIAEQSAVLLEHFRLAGMLHGTRGAGMMMRKFGIRFAAHHPDAERVRRAFITCSTVEEWQGVIESHYSTAAVHSQP